MAGASVGWAVPGGGLTSGAASHRRLAICSKGVRNQPERDRQAPDGASRLEPCELRSESRGGCA